MPSSNTPDKDLSRPVERRVQDALTPISRFVNDQATGALLLISAAILAMVLVNSPWHTQFASLEELRAGLYAGDFRLEKSLHEWINDGLMVLFFFLLGLEVKREFIAGELSDIGKSGAVIAAALGGMVVPAALYALINSADGSMQGWGIPMATDTAFALGVLALLGDRICASIKTFLVALAIVDDIGAILVIAIFYTETLNLPMLGAGAFAFAVLLLLNFTGVRRPLPYMIMSLVLWYCILMSGIHATIAGVLAALAIPARPRIHPRWFATRLRSAAGKLDRIDDPNHTLLASRESHELAERIRHGSAAITTPLRLWESLLERPVSLLVVPIFALFNAGIVISLESVQSTLASPVGLGILAGLVIGKPLGIFSATWLATRSSYFRLPDNVTLHDIVGIGLLAGMGFTMSVFISVLSFGGSAEALNHAKTAITLATLIAGTAGMLWLSRRDPEAAPATPQQATLKGEIA